MLIGKRNTVKKYSIQAFAAGWWARCLTRATARRRLRELARPSGYRRKIYNINMLTKGFGLDRQQELVCDPEGAEAAWSRFCGSSAQ
jgi:hypothetical protein